MQRKRQNWGATWLLPALVLVVIVVCLFALHGRRQAEFERLEPVKGVLDLRGIDVSDQVYQVGSGWEYYPEALYDHTDFAQGVTLSYLDVNNWDDGTPYGTYRLRIQADPCQYYTLCGYSLDYSTRVLVNGVEVRQDGVVTDPPEESIPSVQYMTFPVYVGEDGQAEIIFQYANYVHREGGSLKPLYLSSPQTIQEYVAANTLTSLVVSGGLLVLCLYFLLTAALQRQVPYVCLALCCLVMALRDQLFYASYLLPPEASWYITYRVYIAVMILLPVSGLLLLRSMYPYEKRWVTGLYGASIVVLLLLLTVLDTKQLVTVSKTAYGISVPYLLYLLFTVGRYFIREKPPKKMDWVLFCGFAVLIFSMVAEAMLVRVVPRVTNYGFVPTGLLVFILLAAVSIGLRVQEQKAALAESRSRSEMLQRMNNMNLDFFQKVAHELKTPLTVISGYAQLTEMQLTAHRVDQETPENLRTIHQEAMRLADLVSSLMDYSYGSRREETFAPVELEDLLQRVRAICTPMCLKNQNQVVLAEETGGSVYGSEEMLLQIFINLVGNANRHTQNGTITIRASAGEAPAFVVFRVEDTGEGIQPELLPHLFEKGTSGDGSSGLGLAICREAVEAHGGQLNLEQTGPSGTVFVFTVQREKGET